MKRTSFLLAKIAAKLILDEQGDVKSKGRIKIELKPTDIKFSSSEESSEETSEHALTALYKKAMDLADKAALTSNEQRLIDLMGNLASSGVFASTRKYGYEIPGNYGEYKQMLAKTVEPFDEGLAEQIRTGKGVVGNAIFKSWTDLEYLFTTDERDPRIILTEYRDTIEDALTDAINSYTKIEPDAKIKPDMAEGISKAFVEPYQVTENE